MRKIREKLRTYGAYKQIKYALKATIYKTLTKEEFDEKWGSIFLKKDFWAGMSKTQRVESVHAFFNGYVNLTISLQQFSKQYDNTLRSRVEK